MITSNTTSLRGGNNPTPSLRGLESPTTSLREALLGDEAIPGGTTSTSLTRLPRSQEVARNDGVGLILTRNDVTSQKFEFQEIISKNDQSFDLSLFKGKEWRDELDMKEVLRSLTRLQKQQELAKSGAYDEKIEQLAHDVSSNVGNRMRGMVRSGVITPMASPVVSNALEYVLKTTNFKSILLGERVTSVSGGDEFEIKEKEEFKEEEIEGLPWLEDDNNIIQPNLPKLKPEGDITIGYVDDVKIDDQKLPLYTSKNNRLKFNFVNEAKASSLAISGIGTQVIDLSLLPEAVLLNGLRGIGSSLVSGISTPVIVSGVVGGGLAYGMHQGAKFESEHLLLNEDFDSWMTNPLIPEKVKKDIWNKATNDPLLSNNNQLRNSIINIGPKYFTNQRLGVNNFSPITIPNEIDTRILSTPIPTFKPFDFITDNEGQKLGKMSVVPGFDTVGQEWLEQFPGSKAVESRPSIFSTPFPEIKWDDLVLYKKTPVPQKHTQSIGGLTGTPMPNPNDNEENKEYKTGNFEKGDNVDIYRFTQRVSQQNGNPKWVDPKTGHYIQKDRALNSGSGAHDGAYKLFDRSGNRIGTITKEGKWLRG